MKMSLTADQYRSLAFALTSVTLVAGAAHANSRYGDIHQSLSAAQVAAPQAQVRSLSRSRSGYEAFAEAPAPNSLSIGMLGPESTDYGIASQR
jgi:hypothetical protein